MTIVMEAIMKTMSAGVFRTKCLAVMDVVQARRETVVITKRGKAVAKLVPVEGGADEIYHFLRGKGTVRGDVVAPALSGQEWGDLK